MNIDNDFFISHFETTQSLYDLFIQVCFDLLAGKEQQACTRTLIVQGRLSISREYKTDLLFDYDRGTLTRYFIDRFHQEFLGEYLPAQIEKAKELIVQKTYNKRRVTVQNHPRFYVIILTENSKIERERKMFTVKFPTINYNALAATLNDNEKEILRYVFKEKTGELRKSKVK